ncbi:MAG TPA: hypothetical protein VGO62_17085, partial [Myxococcota bacterium]
MKRPRRALTFGILAAWATTCSLFSGALLAFHLVALPTPARDDPQLSAALAAHSDASERARWHLVHVMYARCPCSKKIIDHLIARGPMPGVAETVLIVGADAALDARVTSAGFSVRDETATSLREQWHIEAAPLFLVADPSGRIRYEGGYTTVKQGPDIEDTAILARAQASDGDVASL